MADCAKPTDNVKIYYFFVAGFIRQSILVSRFLFVISSMMQTEKSLLQRKNDEGAS